MKKLRCQILKDVHFWFLTMKEKIEEFWKRAFYDTCSLIPESCILQNNILAPRFLFYNYFDSSAKHFITKLDATQRTSWTG